VKLVKKSLILQEVVNTAGKNVKIQNRSDLMRNFVPKTQIEEQILLQKGGPLGIGA
jgi:hypothetical protein